MKNLQFRHYNDAFQQQLKTDKDKISQESKVYVKGDKSKNFYKTTPKEYTKLLNKDIHKGYHIAEPEDIKKCKESQKKAVTNIDLGDRVFDSIVGPAYNTWKDHKENFPNTIKTRLITPTRPHLGKVSKNILARVVNDMRRITKYNQWKNIDSVIEWFKKIPKDVHY